MLPSSFDGAAPPPASGRPLRVALVRGALVSPRGSVNNEPTPPIGLAYIAGSLRAAGFAVQGIDATGQALEAVHDIPGTRLQANGLRHEAVVAQLDPATDVVGISTMFSHEWTHHRGLIRAVKARFPGAIVVVGGEHGTALAEYSLRDCPEIDFVVLGEGEETMVELCRTLARDGDPASVAGLAFVRDGAVVHTAPRARVRDADALPWPDWEVFPIEPYLASNISFGASFGRNMPILASRGCPYRCTFCSNPAMWTTRYVVRTPASVLAEIEHYRERYAITGLQFYDLTAIVKKGWIVDFCRLLAARELALDWSLPSGTRSEALDDETLGWLARAHCRYLVYAPESGSPATLQRIKKKIDLGRMERSMAQAVAHGIVVRANLIIGFPDESRREVLATLRAMVRFAWLGVDEVVIGMFQPYPGTEIFEDLRRRGALTVDDTYLNALAEFSTGKLAPPRECVSERLGRFELYAYRMAGTLGFLLLAYALRPRRIWRTIHNVLFTDRSSTVTEQRLRDRVRRLRAAFPGRRGRAAGQPSSGPLRP